MFVPDPESRITVNLVESALWRVFHERQTEMVITRYGRCMFPKLEFDVAGLDDRELYALTLFIDRVDDMKFDNLPFIILLFRYKYIDRNWIPTTRSSEPYEPRPLQCPNWGLVEGRAYRNAPVSFGDLKLSNKVAQDQMVLTVQSLHKYVPRVEIWKLDRASNTMFLVLSEVFPIAEFITVTAYQNPQLSQLKIEYNPYARGFKDGAHVARRKRLWQGEQEHFVEKTTKTQQQRGRGDSQAEEELKPQMPPPEYDPFFSRAWYPHPNYYPQQAYQYPPPPVPNGNNGEPSPSTTPDSKPQTDGSWSPRSATSDTTIAYRQDFLNDLQLM